MAGQIHPVVMCGGSGTRLWPVSRRSYPKQFGDLFPGGSLFQRTLERIAGRGLADPLLLTHQEFRFIVAEQAGMAGVRPGRIVIEPQGRNTAPAVCTAALMVAEADPEGVLLVLPSDHLVADADAFHAAVTVAAAAAREGQLVTFGIRPDRPETGYGYIELSGPACTGAQPFRRFVEKPDAAAAGEMVDSGRYLWNSGMFVFGARAILDAFARFAPEVEAACRAAVESGREDLDFFRLGAEAYAASPDISIDYAIMERVEGQVVPVDCGWNDLGSWATVWQESERDEGGVAAGPNTLAIDCRETLLRSDHPDVQVVGIGLEGVVAVATGDAVLVGAMDRAQEVRRAVEALKARGRPQATDFRRCYRPWGWYETLAVGHRFQVKQIMVRPGGILSLQSHYHRAEHWVVVAGSARVTVGDETRLLGENESVYVPLGSVHRLENPGKLDLRLIEVQSGAYLGEDDIMRYEDVYARA
ncbi:MAG TPA: mannose-1-phosphate guanylyltransferase/mannose-6-phosphate isomerase [Paracoccaceae bacterium]|nr:mannose-1-phosphate guanylyltransferase/mannose-6-phosphate isomerase [Paracoccaceae bacterium]